MIIKPLTNMTTMSKTIAQQLNIANFPFEIKDKEGRVIYYEIFGYWFKREYDSSGKIKYFENSDGKIIDKRSKKKG